MSGAANTEVVMTSSGAADRVNTLDWKRVSGDLDAQGNAMLEQLLSPEECRAIAGLYPNDDIFRSRVVMGRHGSHRFIPPIGDRDQMRIDRYPEFAHKIWQRIAEILILSAPEATASVASGPGTVIPWASFSTTRHRGRTLGLPVSGGWQSFISQ